MAGFSKQIAVLALAAAAAGCSDSFPPVPGPLDRFNFPVGLAVRRLAAGNTALVVVSSNFDLRYDSAIGGAVLAVDPDASGDALKGDPTLAVLGGVNIGSFGGEIDYAQGVDHATGQPACTALTTFAADPFILADGAYAVVASRDLQQVYRISMSGAGGLACDGCGQQTDPAALDPFGVTVACASAGGQYSAKAYVTHLRNIGDTGRLSELDLVTGRLDPGQAFPFPTYSSAYDPVHRLLFVSTRIGVLGNSPLLWFDVLARTTALSYWNVSQDLKASLPRGMVVSQDGLTGYLAVELYDQILAAQGGALIGVAGGLAVYDLSPTALGGPAMKFQRFVSTCLGSGQIRRISRPPKRDLLAITCDQENALLIYDDDAGALAARIALGADGRPILGRQPFGLAVESRTTGCSSGAPCARLYVGSFDQSWVSLLELDPNVPTAVSLVKRIGRER